MPDVEPRMHCITMARASAISTISAATLSNQARAGRLQSVKLGNTLVMTRVWLHEYLLAR